MTRPQHLTLTLTEPQYDALMSATDMYYAVMLDNGDARSSRRAAVVNRAGEALSKAWTRAVDGF